MDQPLQDYHRKRDFNRTTEPRGREPVAKGRSHRTRARARFVIQEHSARTLHYDFRLEHGGVLLSWVLPKGPPASPAQKRLAIRVEDHPLEYATFHGTIPRGEYGAGTVRIWDRGTWSPEPLAQHEREIDDRLKAGTLSFILTGRRVCGLFSLVRPRRKTAGSLQEHWLMMLKNAAPTGRVARKPASPDAAWTEKAIRSTSSEARALRRRPSRRGELESRAAALTGARRASLPTRVMPQLATLVRAPPEDDQWLHEIKFDGYRVLARAHGGKIQLWTRGGLDWSDRFPPVIRALASLPSVNAWVDGEVVVLDDDGRSSFQLLQNALRERGERPVVYYVFDLIYLGNYDLSASPLSQRKALLRSYVALTDAAHVQFSEHIDGDGGAVHQQACRFGLEGIVSKRRDSPYRPGRGATWLKCKCRRRQEFVVVGYTLPGGGRSHFGSLLLACHDHHRKLRYCGRVGTGFTQRSLAELRSRLDPMVLSEPAITGPIPSREARDARWVQPRLVAEVAFAEWTAAGLLRQASFKGLREDKQVREVVCERDIAPPAQSFVPDRSRHGARHGPHRPGAPLKHQRCEIAGVRLSNPDRVLFADANISKRDIASYYESIADYVLPHVVDRPVALVRCPRGIDGACFFQKHYSQSLPDSIDHIDIEGESYVMIGDLAGLIGLVQIGTLEIHPWGARADRLDRPDLLTFDLDPGPGVAWSMVLNGARHLRSLLNELGLTSFVKTSGGKGLHVQFPINRRSPWDLARLFCEQAAKRIVREHPDRYVATIRRSARAGRIFIDYFRNSRGATTVAAYSTRARPGAPVSCPLHWDELDPAITPAHFTIRNVTSRVARIKKEPYSHMNGISQNITRRMIQSLQR